MRNKGVSGVKFVFLIMALVLIYFGYTIYGQTKEIRRLEATIEEKSAEVEKINAEISELEAELDNSDSLRFIEKIARDEYNMVKPKEVIFIDKDKEDNNNPFDND